MSKSLRGSFRIDPEKFKLAQKHFGKEKPQDVIDAFFDGLWLSYYPPKPIAKMEVYARATETAQNLRRGENKEKVEKESKAQISQPNHSTDTVLGKPVKLPEESGIDYSIRLAAWKEQNQLK